MKRLISLLLLMTVVFVGCKKDDPVVAEYIVTFDSQGGSSITALKVAEGQKVTKPADPTKEKATFSGWYKESACTNVWNFDSDLVTQNVTLYAKWIGSDQKTYTVMFETNGGSDIEPAIVVEGEKVLRPADPSKRDYVFDNWYKNSDLSTLYDFTIPVTQNMTLYAKWTTSTFKLVDFEPGSDFESNGIVWDEATRTLDITKATAGSVLKFNAIGASSLETNIEHEYDTYASSIGGENTLKNILVVGSSVSGKIALKVNVPAQTIKVPLNVQATVRSFDNDKEFDVITIKSRPDYAGTGINPVLMVNHTTKKEFYWAPVNVAATKIPVLVPASGDITETCGHLFQWGRKYGFNATADASVTARDTTGVRALGFPVQTSLADMSKWDSKFIYRSASAPNSQGNWLLINGAGKDNPTANEMQEGAWYQKLWNSGTEDKPVRTNADPCPAGWRVPTAEEWKAIGAGNNDIVKEWDSANKLLTIAGAESGQKLILPAAGYRNGSTGASSSQSIYGYYWASSVPSGSVDASNVYFSSATLNAASSNRANGFSVRCVQE